MEPITATMSTYAEFSIATLTEVLLVHGRVTLLLATCLILLRYLKYLKGSAANRHIFISIGLLSTLLLPLSSHVIPAYDIVIEVTRPIVSSALPAAIGEVFRSSISPSERLISLSSAVFIAYLCVAVLTLLRVVLSNLRIYVLSMRCESVQQRYWTKALTRRKKDLNIGTFVTIKHSCFVRSPMTWGVLRPVILIPSQALHWPDQLIHSTLLHELAHIKRGDWLTQQLARCICAVYWINPLCWKALNHLHMYAEAASDDIALASGQDSALYAKDLVNVATHLNAQHPHTMAVLGMATIKQPSQLRLRIQAVLNPSEQHTPLTRAQALLALTVILLVIVPLTSLRANVIEKVNFVISYNEENQHPIQTEEVPEEDDALSRQTPKALTLTEIKNTLLEETNLPSQQVIALDAPVIEKAIVKTELKRLSANEVVERAKQKIAKSFDINDTSATQKQANMNATEKIEQKQDSQPSHATLSSATKTLMADTPIIEPHSVKNLAIPAYPKRAQRKGIEGEVIVEYNLDPYGNVVDAYIVSASPKKVFDKTVLKAIKKSDFLPKKINGKAVSVAGLREKYVFVLKS